MKVYKTQKEVEKDIKDGVLAVNDDVTFVCDIAIDAAISAWNITAWNISAMDISAVDISAVDISAVDISARDITAGNISAGNITAWDITAGNISARNISAREITAVDISARDITYYAFCNVYQSITCTSIKGQRNPHAQPTCLDGELTIKPTGDDEVERAIKLLESKGKLKDGKILT